jgi:hypothetical protein
MLPKILKALTFYSDNAQHSPVLQPKWQDIVIEDNRLAA